MKPKPSEELLPGKGPALVQSLSRGLGILSQFTAQEPALSLAEVSRRTGLHRATAYRFLKTLQAEGFLAFDPGPALYRIGPAWAAALYSLGGNSILVDVLDSDIKDLAERTGEGASLSVRKGDNVQILHVVPTRVDAPTFPTSSIVPLSEHALVHARVHLAYSSEDTKRRMTAVPAIRHTEKTVTDQDEIRARVDRVAEEGIAISCDDYKVGLSALAVPIFFKGDVVAALGVLTHTDCFDESHIEWYSRELRLTSAMMSRKLDESTYKLFPRA